MLALSVVMYAVSTVHWALFLSRVEVFEVDPSSPVDIKDWVVNYLPSITYVLSDVIVLWRAWVLWPGNYRFWLFIPPLILLLCNIGASVASAVLFLEAIQMKPGPVLEDFNTALHLLWTEWFLTFATNLWATGLIFIRAWQHRRLLRSLSVKETFKSNTEQVLAFLVESGALYLGLWIAVIVTSVPQVTFGAESFHTAVAQLVGMYPTMIVVVVALRLSTADVLSRPDAEGKSFIAFTPSSPSPARPKLAQDIENSLDGRSTPALSDVMSTLSTHIESSWKPEV